MGTVRKKKGHSLIDMAGCVFNRWTVLRRDESPSRLVRWICRCSCGTERSVIGDNLRNGISKSCGCYKSMVSSAIAVITHTTHGMYHHPLFGTHKSMIDRCCRSGNKSYKNYGGRGISVHEDWFNFKTFSDYIMAEIGPRPEKNDLDRIDNNKGYEPGNVRWSSRSQNNMNRRNNLFIEHDGVRMTLTQWSEKTGINPSTIKGRMNRGITGSSLFAPVRGAT